MPSKRPRIANKKYIYDNHLWIWLYSAKTMFTPAMFSRRRSRGNTCIFSARRTRLYMLNTIFIRNACVYIYIHIYIYILCVQDYILFYILVRGGLYMESDVVCRRTASACMHTQARTRKRNDLDPSRLARANATHTYACVCECISLSLSLYIYIQRERAIHMFIYIYIERERESYTHVYIYIYIYIPYIYIHIYI